jgi:hypothetical protein
MKEKLYELCGNICMATASAAALGYVAWPGLWVMLHFLLWSSLALAALCVVSLILKAGLKLTESPNERRFWEARKAGEKRFREIFGK